MTGLVQALTLLTVIPTGRLGCGRAYDPRAAVPWFPSVGLLLGLLLAGARAAALHWFAPTVCGVFLVALWAYLTGGLHLDGLCDSGDGLLASVPPERRLEIMKDPRVGSFGAIVLVIYLMLQAVAIAALPPRGWYALLLAPVMGRWLILLAATRPQARPGGMGASIAGALDARALVLAAIVPAVLLALGGTRSAIAAVVAHLVAFAVFRVSRSKLGGVTGDIYGLTVQLAELSVVLVYCARVV